MKQGRSRSALLLTAAGVSAVLGLVTYLLAVRTHLGQRFDNASLLGSFGQDPGSRVHDIFFLERISARSFTAVLVVIVVIGLARRRWRLGVTVALAAFVSVIGTDFLKDHVLTRPALLAHDALHPKNSFPSGHTATAIGCAFALVVLAPPALRGLVAVLAGSYSWVVAADVQTAGWHRPSDAIGAVLLCFAVICVAAAVLIRLRPTSEGRQLAHLPAFVVLGLVGVGSLMVAAYNAARVLRVLHRTPDVAVLSNSALLDDAYRFSVNVTVAIVVTSLIALLLLLGSCDLDAKHPRAEVAPGVDDQPAT